MSFSGSASSEIGPLPSQEQAVSEAMALAAASVSGPAPVAAVPGPASGSSATDLGSQLAAKAERPGSHPTKRDEESAAARGQKKPDFLKPATVEAPAGHTPTKRLP